MMQPERVARFKEVIKCRQPNLTVVLENVHDPHNISAVLRTCDSVGITDVYVLYTKVHKNRLELGKRSSSGARKWINVHLYNDVDDCMKAVKAKYDKIYATHLSEDAVGLYDLDLTESVALLFGNEHSGVSEEALKYCDGNFLIPQFGMVKSLNISVACAVSLYEGLRQRKEKGFYDDSPVLNEAEQEAMLGEYQNRHERWIDFVDKYIEAK
ncbi:MAG: tRNA (guanosine-2'-O-)-methyltransferase [Cognaticolwellia sp.]|jgi:tRNA (guanosine-2'-O-)-methyltransferase